jgi:hypothetical protein
MIYEAENHCPGGAWQSPFYATVGFTRSADGGHTWPAPVNSEFGNNSRRPVLKMSIPEPTTAETPPIAMGNAIPSAFIDTTQTGAHYIYVTYIFVGSGADGYLRMARAKLTDRKVEFEKWYMGSFSQPGIGGLDSGVTPSHGCAGTNGQAQVEGSISYLATTAQYVLTFVCMQLQGTAGNLQPYQARWYYATATSLEKQDWTTPQPIAGSQFPVTSGCTFDGWYPSFMTPLYQPGYLGTTGQVFFLNGCYTAGTGRTFVSRTFSITTGP